METVQLAIRSAPYAKALRDMLSRTGAWNGVAVEEPDPDYDGVLVVDSECLERLPFPLPNPERVVLVTRNDPQHLARAWEAGVHSVVFDQDPLSMVVLAIMAAGLRIPRGKPLDEGWTHKLTQISTSGVNPSESRFSEPNERADPPPAAINGPAKHRMKRHV